MYIVCVLCCRVLFGCVLAKKLEEEEEAEGTNSCEKKQGKTHRDVCFAPIRTMQISLIK